MKGELASIASRFDSISLRAYVRSKLKRDPVYEATWRLLEHSALPVLDIGCGIGLLPMFLRERGFRGEMIGLDTDSEKISIARKVTELDASTTFRTQDAAEGFADFQGSLTMLDVLHYLTTEDQRILLDRAAQSVASGGMAIIRDCPRDNTWRYRATYLEELFAVKVGWLKVPRLNFPTLQQLIHPFASRGFASEVRPLWGKTPFNNHLFVFRRP